MEACPLLKCLGGNSILLILSTGCALADQVTPTPIPTVTRVPPTSTDLPPTTTPIQPTKPPPPTSCGEVEGDYCLELTFDGQVCNYSGPADLAAGNVTLIFINNSEGGASPNLVRHTGDKTFQDMLDTFKEEPSTGHHPSWTVEIPDVWDAVSPGATYSWEGALEPGIHTLVCARFTPFGVWYRGGFTVHD